MGREGDGEEVTELAVEIHRATLGMLDGADDHVREGAESLGEHAQGAIDGTEPMRMAILRWSAWTAARSFVSASLAAIR
ncbi:MAG: hypothetical protein M3O50_21250 [Myxococcota bacterium]|nr:hypothetical protein [Myxococcota bacterium]